MTLLLLTLAVAADRRPLEYAPAPAGNPLKGLVPYAGQGGNRFPHSLEFDYLSLAAVVVGPDRYDWAPFEKLLDAIAGRGHQAVVRFYLEYPAKPTGIPAYLIADGLKVHKYVNTNTQPLPPAEVVTPDYADPKLRKCLTAFIAALGNKYDGDPRLGYLTAGLLGTWGEWHTYPRSELFAKKDVQAEVLDAYEAAFKKTPVLLRYPAGPTDDVYADTSRRPFGYHDDSFCWGTLDTGKADDDWFFVPKLVAGGLTERWTTQPIGGEIRPEAWGQVFDAKPTDKQVQDFTKCVETTHATWLMDSGMFEGKKQPKRRKEQAEAKVRRLGYEFHIPAVAITPPAAGKLAVRAELENRGVAPFYADWRPELGLLRGGEVVRTWPGAGKLTGLLPGDPARVWADALDVTGLPAGGYTLLVRVPNPLPKGEPVRFANRTQDADRAGWLSLGPVTLP